MSPPRRTGLARWALALTAGVAVAAATGCSGRQAGGVEIAVALADHRFDPARLHVRAGERVRVRVRNEGRVVHDFTVPEAGVSSGRLAPGESGVAEFTLQRPGEYRLVCTVPGHEALGMKGVISANPRP